jgi:hypothetical protein
MKITIKQYDSNTNEETIIERDETPQEQADREALIAKMDAEYAEITAKAAAKQSAQDKLKALGLNDAEIIAITGGV